MSYSDLREWLQAVEAHGELKHVSGANLDLEMSTIAELVQGRGKQPKPALLFDDIPGYPKGTRTLFGQLSSPWRLAMTLGLPEDQLERMSLLRNWHKKSEGLRHIPPRFVSSRRVKTKTVTGLPIVIIRNGA